MNEHNSTMDCCRPDSRRHRGAGPGGDILDLLDAESSAFGGTAYYRGDLVRGVVHEVAPDSLLFELFEPNKLTLYDLWELLELASVDDRVSSIYLEVHPLALSWAQIEELRDGMHKFRASGKKIHAFLSLDMAGESEFYLASAADTITINPDAGLLLNGLTAEVQFYKRSLQKLGIKPEFIQFKEFKSHRSTIERA